MAVPYLCFDVMGQKNPFGSLTIPKNSPKSGNSLQKTAGLGFIVLYE
jgi:hypothetical protein